jgi:hypothetical protein
LAKAEQPATKREIRNRWNRRADIRQHRMKYHVVFFTEEKHGEVFARKGFPESPRAFDRRKASADDYNF